MATPLSAVRACALALPDTTEAPHHQYGSFRVRGKIFATVPPGDVLLHLFLPDDARDHALAMDPEFLEPLLWGTKVVGVRVHLPLARRITVLALVRQAYDFKAAKVPRRRSLSAKGSATEGS